MQFKDDCLFCKIVQGEIPAEKIFENEHVFAFKDLYPQAKTHILIIPKFHVDSVAHLKSDQFYIMEKLYEAATAIADKLGFKEKGFRSVINTGDEGGQTVFHLHLHILAGNKVSPKFG